MVQTLALAAKRNVWRELEIFCRAAICLGLLDSELACGSVMSVAETPPVCAAVVELNSDPYRFHWTDSNRDLAALLPRNPLGIQALGDLALGAPAAAPGHDLREYPRSTTARGRAPWARGPTASPPPSRRARPMTDRNS